MPDKQQALSIVVPCFNEAEALDDLVSNIRKLEEGLGGHCGLIFVDDGSSDSTYDKLAGAYNDRMGVDVKIVRHSKNSGVGAAVRTGFAHAEGDYVAAIDSDCTYDLGYLPKMLELIKKQNADIITGSPYHPEGSTENMPPYRLFLSKNLSRLYNFVTGAGLYTYTSIFRIYRSEVIKRTLFKSDGFLFTAEILVNAHKQGFRIIEYPAALTTRRHGASKAKIFRMIRDHAGFIIRLLLKKEERT